MTPADSDRCNRFPGPEPATTFLDVLVRGNIETWLAGAAERDDYGRGRPLHIEAGFRGYRKDRDLCPSWATRHMADVSAHMVDAVLPRVQHRQWLLSRPKRVRWHRRHKPEMISGLLTVFLRAVAFVHRFGSYLNSHVHFHVLVTDGVFSAGSDGEDGEAVFQPALDLDQADFTAVQSVMRTRGLRWLHRHVHLDDDAMHVFGSSEHAGGWSVDAAVTIAGWDRHRLI